MHTQKGFSLIELLAVVAIISVLASMAIVFFQNHLAKAQITEVLVLAGGLKTKVMTSLENSSCGNDIASGKYGIAMAGGIAPDCTITFTFNNTNASSALSSKTIGLDILSNGTLKKNADTDVDSKYLPKTID
ncbi:pilin [Acinetobacter tibetensis]|uniref:pilin n=1 Tax=Acinetobacter tibetensis TaxID=2943497 RepID=UPI003A4D3B99